MLLLRNVIIILPLIIVMLRFFTYFHFTKPNGCKMEAAALKSSLGGSSSPNDDSIPATITAASLVTDAMSQENLPVMGLQDR